MGHHSRVGNHKETRLKFRGCSGLVAGILGFLFICQPVPVKELNNVKIVLVNTSHPGNIGASARAMKNMCMNNLALVDP